MTHLQHSSSLSAEQLRRMQENKKKAKERLAQKRSASTANVGNETDGINYSKPKQQFQNPPPAKRPALVTGSKTFGTSNNTNSHSVQFTHVAGHSNQPSVHSTYSGHSFSGSSSGTQNVTKSHPSSSRHHSSSVNHSKPFYSGQQKPVQSFLSSSSSSKTVFTSTNQDSRNPAKTSFYPHQPSSSSSNVNPRPQKFSEMQKKIKANLTLVSKTRFKVLVPYESNVIEIFKRMPTRSYDAKTATWSFGIEDYNRLVDAIQRECKYVDLNLIPKPVVALFNSKKTASDSKTTSNVVDTPIDWSRIDTKLSSTLMQFQREGVEFSIRHGGRVLIADDMGLGKTLQAIAVMCYYRSDWPLLVMCPSSVRLTWAEAFQRWLPSLREENINVVLTTKTSAAAMNGVVNIISYDLLVKMAKEIQAKRFMAIVSDESHFLKNYKTVRCKSALPILKTAKRCILLSGTPALSRPIELYTQITVLDKNFSRGVSMVEFGLRYCNGVKNHFGWDFSGASNMAELQMYMEEAIMIRRFKTDVLDQLPSKRRQMVLLDPSLTKGKSREVKEMKEEIDKAGTLKAMDQRNALLPLFEKTGRMKLPAIRDYILDLLEGGRKVIVFGHHKSILDGISETLDSKMYGYIRIDGRTPAELRQTYCDQFQHDEKCLVAVLSITTANAGLTLTAASTVVFAELFWNPGILVQAEDRAYRIGQKSSVNVHYLVAKDTADDFIWPMIQNKLDVLSQAGLTKDDFSKADSTLLKDATQKNLFQCFNALISKSEVEQLCEIDDTDTVTQTHGQLSNSEQCSSNTISDRNATTKVGLKKKKETLKPTSTSRKTSFEPDPDFEEKKATFRPPFKPPSKKGQRTIQTSLTSLSTKTSHDTHHRKTSSTRKTGKASSSSEHDAEHTLTSKETRETSNLFSTHSSERSLTVSETDSRDSESADSEKASETSSSNTSAAGLASYLISQAIEEGGRERRNVQASDEGPRRCSEVKDDDGIHVSKIKEEEELNSSEWFDNLSDSDLLSFNQFDELT